MVKHTFLMVKHEIVNSPLRAIVREREKEEMDEDLGLLGAITKVKYLDQD